MNEKIVDNRFVPKCVPRNLPWYEREGLLTWYKQTKCEQFLQDTDNHFEKLQITNFDIINANGKISNEKLKQYQTVDHQEIMKYPHELREQINIIYISFIQRRWYVCKKRNGSGTL